MSLKVSSIGLSCPKLSNGEKPSEFNSKSALSFQSSKFEYEYFCTIETTFKTTVIYNIFHE